MYYPTKKSDDNKYFDMKWASDGENTLKGLMKFALDILPANPFKHLLNLRMNIRYKAPLAPVGDPKKIKS